MNSKILIILLLLFFTIVPAEAQCAMCRAVIESEENGTAAVGINNGIIYLMIIPYLLVAGVGYAVYRMRQKAKMDED